MLGRGVVGTNVHLMRRGIQRNLAELDSCNRSAKPL